MDREHESDRVAELLARLTALREENERLRAELTRYRIRENETPPHYL